MKTASDRPRFVENVFEKLSAVLNGTATVEDHLKYPFSSGSPDAPEPLPIEGMYRVSQII